MTALTATLAAAAVTLLAGVLVLGGAIAAGHHRRVYDAVVLKVLGARRREVMATFLLEYGLTALATAAIALLVAGLGQEQAGGRDGVLAGVPLGWGAHPRPRTLAALEPPLGLQAVVGGDHGRAADRQRPCQRPLGRQHGPERHAADVDGVPQRARELPVQGSLAVEVALQQIGQVRAGLADWLVQYRSNNGVRTLARRPMTP
jgi:hypothetical protein